MNDCSISVSLIKVSPINTPMIPIDLSDSKSSAQLIPDSLMGIIFCFKNISAYVCINSIDVFKSVLKVFKSLLFIPIKLKDFNPENIAICYEGLGASCISVLTDKRFFQGSYEILETVRKSTNLPLLCKDFIISAYQIYKARVSGADAILLIAAILSDDDLIYLKKIADNLKMSVLVEVHNSNELERILKLKSFNLIGINNRDLKTFKTDLKTSIELMHTYADIFLKQNIIPISESGINCAEDLESLRSIGIMGVLIGETFMRETDIEQSFKKLFNSI